MERYSATYNTWEGEDKQLFIAVSKEANMTTTKMEGYMY